MRTEHLGWNFHHCGILRNLGFMPSSKNNASQIASRIWICHCPVHLTVVLLREVELQSVQQCDWYFPWTSLICMSSTKCVHMCVSQCVCTCVTTSANSWREGKADSAQAPENGPLCNLKGAFSLSLNTTPASTCVLSGCGLVWPSCPPIARTHQETEGAHHTRQHAKRVARNPLEPNGQLWNMPNESAQLGQQANCSAPNP